MSSSVKKNKWSLLCVIFYIHNMPNRDEVLVISFEDFVSQMNELVELEPHSVSNI